MINIKNKGLKMSIRKSITMMSNTGSTWNIVGEPVRGNAYYGYTDGIHTVQVIYQNFVGEFGIQGTLAINPSEEDWFWIQLGSSTDKVQYPVDVLNPTGSNGGDTGSNAFTFVGNFTHLRAVLSRSHLISPPATAWDTWTYGQIDKVLLSL